MQFLSTLFGDKPLAVLGVFAALVVLVAFVVILVRALSGHNFRTPGGRMRQQRLGVVDAFDLDRQRQLILIRRDNVEHLVMIGGPNDVLVEAAIIRQPSASGAVSRTEPSAPALAATTATASGAPRAPSNGSRPDFEPPTREPALPPAPGLSGAPPAPSGPRLPFPSRAATPPPLPVQRPPVLAPPREPAPAPAPHPIGPPKPEPVLNVQPAPTPEPSRAPALVVAPAVTPPPVPAPPVTPPPLPAPPLSAPPVAPPPTRLNAVRAGPPPRPLRPFPTLRPGGGPLFPVRPAGPPSQTADAPGQVGAPDPGQSPTPGSPTETAAKPAKEATETQVLDSFESLEEEMAKLLGRPSSH